MSNQEKQAVGAFKKVLAVAETIRELKGVPSGHLYAQLMGFFSLEEYNKTIEILKNGDLVKEENFFLTWIGR